MLPALEGLLFALLVLLYPGDTNKQEVTPRSVSRADGCERFANDRARRNCLARVGRESAETNIASVPSELVWIAPEDPGMPDRLTLMRGGR